MPPLLWNLRFASYYLLSGNHSDLSLWRFYKAEVALSHTSAKTPDSAPRAYLTRARNHGVAPSSRVQLATFIRLHRTLETHLVLCLMQAQIAGKLYLLPLVLLFAPYTLLPIPDRFLPKRPELRVVSESGCNQ